MQAIRIAIESLASFAERNFETNISNEALRSGSFKKKILSKLSGFSGSVDLRAEGKHLVFYQKVNGKLESIRINSTSASLDITEGETNCYVILHKYFARMYLSKEIITLRLSLALCRDKNTRTYLRQCIETAKAANRRLERYRLNSEASINIAMAGVIQYAPSSFKRDIHVSYKNHVAFQSTSNAPKTLESASRAKSLEPSQFRVIVFYLDNISKKTAAKIKSSERDFPTLSRLLQKSFVMGHEISVSNWTLPAAISMATGKSFSLHKHFHNNSKPSFRLNSLIYSADKASLLRERIKLATGRFFYAGTNWRLKQEHGLHAIYEHAMSSPRYGDIYDTSGAALKQLEIAGSSPSFHWISFMDSHHPVQNAVLPGGVDRFITSKTLLNGYDFRTGPKTGGSQKSSAEEIYFSQLRSIDGHVKILLEKSFEAMPRERHIICLVSDHGTSFLHQENLESTLREKHSSLLRVWTEDPIARTNINANKKYSYRPEQIWELLADLMDQCECTQNQFHPYSEIAYPGSNYEFLYFFDACIYKYRSAQALPKALLSSRGVSRSMANALSSGSWSKIVEDQQHFVSMEDLPESVTDCFSTVSHEWTLT